MMKRTTWAIALTAVLAMAAAPASAATIYIWDGGTGTWNDDAHWSGSGLPAAGDTAVVNGGTVQNPTLSDVGDTPFPADLELNGGTLNFHNNLTANFTFGHLYLKGGDVLWELVSSTTSRLLAAPIDVQADTTVNVTGSLMTLYGSTITGDHKLTKSGTGVLFVRDTANSAFSGGWAIDAGSVKIATGVGSDGLDSNEHLGSGNVSLASGATLFFYTTGAANIYLNNSVSGSGTISIENSYGSSQQSDLYGSGIALSPGDSTAAGTLTVTNHSNDSCSVILSDTVLSIGLGGATAGSYDQLKTVLYNTKNTGDDFLLNSNVVLELASLGGFSPDSADTFTIVDNVSSGTAVAGTVGRFANDNGFGHLTGDGWSADVTYVGGDGNDIVLSNVAFVPEPATLAFLGLGGLAMAAGAIRRRRRG